ncbi:DUF2512 family protein [Bacillus sp. CRN 9]|uniref:DUF2512 family protein n=1 Tax=Cytobacillus horneckiae TaxID=549687 RepID=UPI001C269FD9
MSGDAAAELVTSYLGDLFILPRINNTIATIAGLEMAFIIIWLMGENLTYGGSIFIPGTDSRKNRLY